MSAHAQLDQAITHHRSGQLDAAERGYRSLLDVEPGHPDALHLLGVTLGQRGQLGEALRLIEEALARRPGVAAYHGNRGEVLRKMGRNDEAMVALLRALELDSTLATAHNNLGMIRLHRRHADLAVESFQEATRLRPDFAVAYVNLGDALQSLGRLEETEAAYRKALEIEPNNPWVYTFLGHVLVELGDIRQLDEALEYCRRGCALLPGEGKAHTNLGSALSAIGRIEEALESFSRALELDPTLSIPWNNIGQAEQQRGRFEAARAAYEKALAMEPRHPRFHANLAGLLAEEHRYAESIEQYRAALECDPNHAEGLSGMALVFLTLGRRDEARAAIEEAIRLQPRRPAPLINSARFFAEEGDFERSNAQARAALALNPNSPDAYFVLAMNLGDRLPDAELQAMKALLDQNYVSDSSLAALAYSVATILDARGCYEEAARFFSLANARQAAARARKGEFFNLERSTREFEDTIACFTPEVLEALRGRGNPSRRPIFVVGMPRSGTTLIEQVLASHPRVFGAGELTDVLSLARELSGVPESQAALVKTLLSLGPASLRALADRYIARLDELAPAAQHVVDKMPGNYLYLGLITTLWPEARIIVALRDPRDVAVSCWSTYFGVLRWANDLRHIAAQIIQHDRLIAHWKAVLPSPLIEVSYEALVADFEPQARRLIDAVGLPWDPACLEFHSLKRPIRTASLKQVRQPIYSRSIGRWKHYEAALAPFCEMFARHNHPVQGAHTSPRVSAP